MDTGRRGYHKLRDATAAAYRYSPPIKIPLSMRVVFISGIVATACLSAVWQACVENPCQTCGVCNDPPTITRASQTFFMSNWDSRDIEFIVGVDNERAVHLIRWSHESDLASLDVWSFSSGGPFVVPLIPETTNFTTRRTIVDNTAQLRHVVAALCVNGAMRLWIYDTQSARFTYFELCGNECEGDMIIMDSLYRIWAAEIHGDRLHFEVLEIVITEERGDSCTPTIPATTPSATQVMITPLDTDMCVYHFPGSQYTSIANMDTNATETLLTGRLQQIAGVGADHMWAALRSNSVILLYQNTTLVYSVVRPDVQCIAVTKVPGYQLWYVSNESIWVYDVTLRIERRLEAPDRDPLDCKGILSSLVIVYTDNSRVYSYTLPLEYPYDG